jgi:2'-5' RNA ligase
MARKSSRPPCAVFSRLRVAKMNPARLNRRRVVVNDLFPASLQPQTLGFDAVPRAVPVFFAIYPSADELPRVAAWQRRVCQMLAAPGFTLRPSELLHVSVAACGVPRQQREPLARALQLASQRFAHPPFELTMETVTRFGAEGRAFVAVADKAGTRAVQDLRIALADAQKSVGLTSSRAMSQAHLTLGYGDGLPDGSLPVEPMRFRVGAVDLVASHVGESKHTHLGRWRLT